MIFSLVVKTRHKFQSSVMLAQSTAAWVSKLTSSSEVDLFFHFFFSLSISFIRFKGVATLPFDPTVPVTGEDCTERQCLNLKSGLDVHKHTINFNFHSLIHRVNSLTKSCNKHNQFFQNQDPFFFFSV